MKFRDLIKISWSSIRANKIRAILTTLGIVIGIGAVIAMLSIGQGAQEVILNQVQGLGANTITIIPVSNFRGPQSQASVRQLLTQRLDRQLVDLLENKTLFPEISAISPEISSSYEVSYRSTSSSFSVYGVTESYFGVRDITPEQGRLFNAREVNSNARTAVVGYRVVERIFGLDTPLGQSIKINGQTFTIVGVLPPKSTSIDSAIYIPMFTAQNVLIGERNFSQIVVKVSSTEVIDAVAVKVEEELTDYYQRKTGDDGNFSVYTSQDLQVLAETVTSIFTTLLASIASISLIVGGIGIMNIMLVSVSERTKEIGLRKAVGAKQGAILGQFLMESVMLTLIGGIIGIISGVSLAFVIGTVGNFTVVLSWQSILLATSVSISIGIIFGYYPAYRAARLNPIDALRSE